MRIRVIAVLAAAILGSVPVAARAELALYVQHFESLPMDSSNALGAAGWLVFGNVFNGVTGAYMYGYGPFPAPNGTSAFCDVDSGQGGPEQGHQQLSVYSNYNDTQHASGNLVESNVYQERDITASDVGRTWVFEFDAKLGLLEPPTTAVGFIKTLNPVGWVLTNFLTVDMTNIPATWDRYSLSITIGPNLEGQKLQFGFANTATNYTPSGIFYDNVVFHDAATAVETSGGGTSRPGGTGPAASVSPNPLNPSGALTFRTSSPGPVTVRLFDLAGRSVRTVLEGQVLPAGRHEAAIDGLGADGIGLPSGVYFYRVETAEGRATGRFTILK